MRMIPFKKILLFLSVFLLLSNCTQEKAETKEKEAIKTPKKAFKMEAFNGGYFSMVKPAGWEIITAGQCSELAFLVRDPRNHIRRVFYFGQVGPVYLNQQQKQIDLQYMQIGGYPVTWFEMPVVQPLTPENFLKSFHLIAQTRIARNFMPQMPPISRLEILSSTPQPNPMQGTQTALICALFQEGSLLGEGLFLVTVAPLIPFTGGPGSSIGYGFMITGITAPADEFIHIQGNLTRVIESFTLENSYVSNCLRQQAETYAGILKAGKTLSETSDIIMDGWNKRNMSDDIISQKRSDAILGRERLYDPDSGNVYEFQNGFYDKYRLKQNRYNLKNLQPIPGNRHDLWTSPMLDGMRELRVE